MNKKLLPLILIITNAFALPLQVGDTSPNFTTPICANGTGGFDLYTESNGLENGGLFKVTWITLFASW